jgi:hypothetical protein
MNAKTTLALAKAIASKAATAARAKVKPGSYPVDVTVHVHGDLEVAEDGEKTATSALLSEDALIIALRLAGCTRERAVDVISTMVAQALLTWTGSDEDKARAKAERAQLVDEYDADGAVRAMLNGYKAALPRTKVAGAVKFSGDVEEVL